MEMNTAKIFAEEWITAWNSHDLEKIITHYADELEFYSPFIHALKFNDLGVIKNIADLRKYFEIGLKTYPDLHFKLHNYFVGLNTIVLYYTSVSGRIASEVFELNELGKAVKVYCNYTTELSKY
ncbi:MAG: nuclear transport factor 2 family protein [Raineya sp.]|jgi:hypothetical protein|nr:nuclear transport factor 2 family protein [Raineya sp.]